MPAPRYLCSQLVRLRADGVVRWANLEEIWPSGAVLECEEGAVIGGEAKIFTEAVTFEGTITNVQNEEIGWQIEIAFSEATPWSIELWKPEHLFDPDTIK